MNLRKHIDTIVTVVILCILPIVAQAADGGSTGTAQDLNAMLASIQQSVPGVIQLTFAICYVMGVWFVFRGVHKLKLYGEMRTMMSNNASMTKPTIFIMVGVGCIYLPTLMDTALGTLWGYGTDSVVAYPIETDPFVKITRPLIWIVRAFGLISIVRGWIMLTKLGHEGAQPGTAGKSIMHIIGGIALWNIVGLWELIKNTVGIG